MVENCNSMKTYLLGTYNDGYKSDKETIVLSKVVTIWRGDPFSAGLSEFFPMKVLRKSFKSET